MTVCVIIHSRYCVLFTLWFIYFRMWKRIKTSKLFITYTSEYEIYVTDYVTIWYKYFNKTTFLRHLKDCNVLLEMSDEALLQKGLQVLSNPEGLKNLETKQEVSSLVINMTMLFGYLFKLKLELCKGSNELFFSKLTQPLLKTVLELKSSQTELCTLLKKKDSEIEEYKCEGGEIALKHLKTKPFNEQSVLSKYLSFDMHFGGTNDIVSNLIEEVLEIPEDKNKICLDLLSEPISIKMEGTSQNSNSKEGTVKVEPNSQNTSINKEHNTQINFKQEIESQSASIKQESNTQILNSQFVTSVNDTLDVNQDSQLSIKRESQSIPMVRKKMKKLF